MTTEGESQEVEASSELKPRLGLDEEIIEIKRIFQEVGVGHTGCYQRFYVRFQRIVMELVDEMGEIDGWDLADAMKGYNYRDKKIKKAYDIVAATVMEELKEDGKVTRRGKGNKQYPGADFFYRKA
jgi:hypothetical protein